MSRSRIQIVYNNCPRCGRPMAGLSKAIHGSDDMRMKYAGLCSKCVTPEEHKEILDNQAEGILKAVK